MIAVGNGEPCPYCKGEDKFISQPDNDLMKHLIANHRKEFLATLFGDVEELKGKDWK